MTKKILSGLKSNVLGDALQYTFPVYHDTASGAYIDFKAFDPAAGRLRRKKVMLNHIANRRERRKFASLAIAKFAERLRDGWNPWCDDDSYRCYTKLSDVLDRYLDHVAKSGRERTVSSYRSRVNVFREFLAIVPNVQYVYQLDRKLVVDFLDYLSLDRDVGARTVNNYRGWIGSLAEFLVDRKFIDANPVSSVPKLREDGKKRRALSAEMLRLLYAWLDAHDRHFLLAVMMEYYTFIRPSELTGLRLGDFSVIDQKVRVAASISKNGKDGYVGVPDGVLRLMVDLGVFSRPSNYFLFGRDFVPSENRLDPDAFNKRWREVRRALGWGDEYQFYSLKDSGIRDLANAKGIVIARDQARHSDVSTTNKYLGAEDGVREETKRFVGSLG